MSSGDFFQDVFEIVRLIPKGRVSSYGAIANALGKSGAARQVGYALNNCPSDVPAHRVLNRKGMLSGKHYFGEERMKELLELEGLKVENDVLVNFEKYFWDPSNEL
jgi:methylated-DNA-protein-cysteine methyltransferase related protein